MSDGMALERASGPKRRKSGTAENDVLDTMQRRTRNSSSPTFAEETTVDAEERSITRNEGINFARRVADGFKRVVGTAENDKIDETEKDPEQNELVKIILQKRVEEVCQIYKEQQQ